MYKVSVPVLLREWSDKEAILEELKRANAERVFLAIGAPHIEAEKNKESTEQLKEFVPYFKEHGIETGIWFWTFWRKGVDHDSDFLMTEASGRKRVTESVIDGACESAAFCCPESEAFRKNAAAYIEEIAKVGADILMFDDDYRYGWLSGGAGCFCEDHLRKTGEKLGRAITREELVQKIYEGKTCAERTAWQEALGESLETFASMTREVVDSVNPNMRVAMCACMPSWDADGTTACKIAKLLAGNTKPLLRLIGAPYWGVHQDFGRRLQQVIEQERMEASWAADEGIEIMTEGDVFPRPRYCCPASYLEIFDTALRASHTGDGILKYMLDYTGSPRYETGYIDRHEKNQKLYKDIERIFEGKKYCGVRVYEYTNKFERADLTGVAKICDVRHYSEFMCLSQAARVLSDCSVPTCYEGNFGAGIAFGENARYLDEEALQNGLILDIRAAKILKEKGIDVGLVDDEEGEISDVLYYPDYNEYAATSYTKGSVRKLRLQPNAVVKSYFLFGKEKFADAYEYENKDGKRFLVFAFDAFFADERCWRNYGRQKQMFDAITWLSGKKLPVKCVGCPDLYLQSAKDEKGNTAIGFWNVFADDTGDSLVAELDGTYKEAEFIRCGGRLEKDKLILDRIEPFGYGFVLLKK